jgi:hypothetical protein
MIFRFHGSAGLSVYCGKLLHMQSVREGRNANRHLFLWFAQYRTTGKCLSLCCKDSFMTFWYCRFMLMSYFQLYTSAHSLSQQQHVTGQAVPTLESLPARMCWVCCVPEFHHSAFSSVVTRRNTADQDIIELVSESDSDEHSLEDISAHSDSNTDDVTDTNCRQWTDNTHSQPTVPVR